jgi:lysophospholipase L1-like esterase
MFVMVVIASTALGVADAATPRWGSPRGVVAFVGDSNEIFTAQYPADDLLNRMNGYVIVNLARGGSSIRFPDCSTCTDGTFWRTRIQALRSRMSPDAYVVNFGINDARSSGAPTSYGYGQYGAKIDWIMPLFGGAAVFWSNLPCKIEPADWRAGCVIINKALADARDRWPNLIVLSWNTIANSHPEYLGEPLGIHLTAEGGTAWSEMVTNALDARFPI